MQLTQQVTAAMDYMHFPFHRLASEITLHSRTESSRLFNVNMALTSAKLSWELHSSIWPSHDPNSLTGV